MSRILTEDLLFKVERPGQYLGNEWGRAGKPFSSASVRLCLAFPDLYELGMSNFGQRILYQIVNSRQPFMCDRCYAPGRDMEALLRERTLPLFGWESKAPLSSFEILGFSLAYELTYTNVLNMINLAGLELESKRRSSVFPLVFGGGPATVNPEPMARFLDFFIIGDGEKALIDVMECIEKFKQEYADKLDSDLADGAQSKPVPERAEADSDSHSDFGIKHELLMRLAKVDGVYVPALYTQSAESAYVVPKYPGLPARILRQVAPLNNENQPTEVLVPYLSTVHDRLVLEVRRGCDRGCRFCQPGYTFLPVRERSSEDLVKLSKEAISSTGYQEYSMLSLCVSDYTSLHESVRALNQAHSSKRTSMSFPSQRADRMNLEVAEELKVVRKSGITLAPEAGTERLRAVINKGLRHEQIISAIEAAYKSGWSSVKLYYMIGLPTEEDEDLDGIVNTLKEATACCDEIKRQGDPETYRKRIEFTCTISNFVPKPFTPFQWFAQVSPSEFARKQKYLMERLKASGLRNVHLNYTDPETSLLESVISRGDRGIAELIYRAWKRGCTFDAWGEEFKPTIWYEEGRAIGLDLVEESCRHREPGTRQAWDIVHVGLADWWLLKEWQKALAVQETGNCTENTCHACGVCTELSQVHVLAAPKPEVMKKNPFVKELAARVEDDGDVHPSLFFEEKPSTPPNQTLSRLRLEFSKLGDFKFISHLDLQHLFIRAARRAGLELSHSEGFNPSPKISVALSLPIFAEGEAELVDLELSEFIDAESVLERLNAQLPELIQIKRARKVEKTAPSLPTLIGRASYKARYLDNQSKSLCREELILKVREILDKDQILVEMALSTKAAKKASRRKKAADAEAATSKVKDIRRDIFSIEVCEADPISIAFCISHGSKAHLKPTEVIKLLAPDTTWQIIRTGLFTETGVGVFETDV